MKTRLTSSPVLPIELCEQRKDWASWLQKNHSSSSGVWLQLAKADTGIRSVSYEEAVEVALCFGWIDGQKKKFDDQYWLQKFTPRSKKSVWSKINKEKALALIASGKMKPAGLKAVEAAKLDGRWNSAYDAASKSVVPKDFQSALDGNVQARKFFATLDNRNRYAVLFRIQTARNAEVRAKKIAQFVQMLERNEKIHS
ncbi:MAG: YdeI/OmpD-associated family protein [Gammaproteobacteria bacterium]|nr:YdeI/OmpD-associated family protein [Gammaproteobacteria bacterium]